MSGAGGGCESLGRIVEAGGRGRFLFCGRVHSDFVTGDVFFFTGAGSCSLPMPMNRRRVLILCSHGTSDIRRTGGGFVTGDRLENLQLVGFTSVAVCMLLSQNERLGKDFVSLAKVTRR